MTGRLPALGRFARATSQWHPPNIADDAAALLSGAALWLALTDSSESVRHRLSRSLGMTVMVLSALVMADTFMGWGLARLVAPQDVAKGPNTSLAFFALGGALWLLDRQSQMSRQLVQVCVGLAGAVAVLAIYGDSYDVDALSRVGTYSRMPLPTAVAIAVLATGVLFARPDRGVASVLSGEGVGSVMARWLIVPILVIQPTVDLLSEQIESTGLWAPGVATMAGGILILVVLGSLALTTFSVLERIDARRRAVEQELRRHREDLQELVDERTGQLAAANDGLQQEKDLSEAVIHGLPGIFCLLDATGRVVRTNTNFERVTGLPGKEPWNVRLLDVIAEEHREEVARHITEAVASGHATAEANVVASDGSVTPCLFSWVPLTLEGAGFVVAIGFDITERRKAERDRDRLFNFSLDMLVIADFEGRLRQVNPAFSKTLGWTSDELSGQMFLNFVHPDDLERTINAMRDLEAGREVHGFENRYWTRSGEIKWLSWNTFPVLADRVSFSIARDVTEHKKSEAELHRLNAELGRRATDLELANAELEAFSYSVSHDLRAPLRTIDGFSRILIEEYSAALHQEAQRYLTLVRQGAQQMGRLIDDLLVFSRMGRQALRREPVDTTALVRSVVEELERDGAGRSIAFRVTALPPCVADPALLHQVWMNLLDNAVKFTAAREAADIEVGSSRKNGEIVYYVKDNGAGFDMTYAGKLFGIFQRLHSAKEFPGTGVGLAIVQRIVSRHGGRIWAEAVVDRGATFYFTLGSKGT